MVIPYVDMLRAVVRRTRAGLSPFAADRKHLHHSMMEIGHSHRSSVLILYAWSALFAATVVGLSISTVSLAVLVWTTLAAVLALALLSLPKLRWWERNRQEVPVATTRAVTHPAQAEAQGYADATRQNGAGPGQVVGDGALPGRQAVGSVPADGNGIERPPARASGRLRP
jgi:UDP-GlcNAc:undecaprenyl-phosphate/decaprenyl-phosphate GlcNAc-1-phosphate transferase